MQDDLNAKTQRREGARAAREIGSLADAHRLVAWNASGKILIAVQYPKFTHFRQDFFTTKSTKDTKY
jgi:hypothetical protein